MRRSGSEISSVVVMPIRPSAGNKVFTGGIVLKEIPKGKGEPTVRPTRPPNREDQNRVDTDR